MRLILKRQSFIRRCNSTAQAARLALILTFNPFVWKALMQRRNLRAKPRQIARRHNPGRWATMNTNTHSKPALWREDPPPLDANRSSLETADAALEFGRFRVLLRQRQLLASDVPVELGTRAFDLLLVLLEADGLLLTKEELVTRVWPDVVVSEENLKVQVSALRKALGADRDVIRTEFGRGYRFTGIVRSNVAPEARQHPTRPKERSGLTLFSQNCRQSPRCGFISS
jgi:DNA-binding winged helix-turn-helix (wHTH) protein